MKKVRDWLEGVEAILRSGTGNMRLLAELAGEDPATVYIGTNLDGTDLRGQDLRGMRFTHLNIINVRVDGGTQIDGMAFPIDSDDDAQPPVQAIVLVRDDRINLSIGRRHAKALSGLEIYKHDEEQTFIETLRNFTGPAFIIDGPGSGTPDFTEIRTKRLVVRLVLHRESRGRLKQQSARFASPLGPSVMVPIGGFGPVSAPPGLTGALADALMLFVDDWSLARKIAAEGPVWAYFRARIGSNVEEVWARVLTSVMRSGILGSPGFRLSNATLLDDGPDRAFFPQLRPLPSHWDTTINSADATVLLDISAPPVLEPQEAYAEGIGEILSRNGWLITRAAHNDFPPLEVMSFSGSRLSFEARLESTPPPRRFSEHRWENLDPERLSTIRRIVFSEWASERQVYSQLVEFGDLWVTAGDISGFYANAESIWPLIGQQSKRISKAFDALGRTQYFTLIVRAALGMQPHATRMDVTVEDMIHSVEFPFHHVITSSVPKSWMGDTICKLKVFESESNFRGGELAELELVITPDGPTVRQIA